MPGLEPRRADLAVAGAILLDDDPAPARRRRDHAVRSVAARRARPRLHRAAPEADRAGRSLSRRPAPQRRSSSPSAATTGRSTRSRWRGSRSRSSIRRARSTASTDREREWLEYAALLHDIGVHISYEGHHKHSYYLIKNGDLRGFEPDEIEIDRARRALSPPGDAEAQARRLRAICRARRGATRAHARGDSAARRKPRSQPRADDHRPRAPRPRRRRSAAAAHDGRRRAELWAAARHAAPFERLTGKPLRIEVEPVSGAGH